MKSKFYKLLSQLKVFDFGGDRVYHMAYHMTIRSNCIPIIVVNMEDFAKLSNPDDCKEAARVLVIDYMLHLYTSSPHLGPPLLVLTHRDKFADVDTFNVCKTQLLTALRCLISDMLQKEKIIAKRSLKVDQNRTIFRTEC